MAIYQYKARDNFGKAIQGIMGADSENAVADKLKEMGYVPVAIRQARKQSLLDKILDRLRGVRFSDLNIFTRQFFALQKAGLPLLSSLNALREEAHNTVLKEVIGQLIREVEAGSNLSSALERHPRVFNNLYVNLVRSGETTGKLAEALERLANLGEHEEMIRLRIKAAMRYPIIVVITIIIGFLVLTTLVMPRFARVYSQFNTVLPLPTRLLLGVNYAVRNFWWLLIIIFAVGIFLVRKFIATEKGRFLWDNLKLKLPIFGPLLLKLTMSRFSRVVGTLMRSGVPILQILELVSESVGNTVVSRTIDNIKVSVNEGKGMLEPMKISGMFPPVVIQMVSVGEETGKVDELLLHVSDYYDSQIDYTINNLVSLIEPILILVLGCAVLFMALGVFLPMWNLMSLFKR